MTLRGTVNKCLKAYDKVGKWLDRFKYFGAMCTIIVTLSHLKTCNDLNNLKQQCHVSNRNR